MKKLKLLGKYILVLLVCPKQAAEAVNEAQDERDLDERILKI